MARVQELEKAKGRQMAIEHATRRVPIASPDDLAGSVRAALLGREFDCATHVVVCDTNRFVGILRIETLLAAPAAATVASVMDSDPPVVEPGVDQEVAAWRAVRQQRAALSVVDGDRRFVGLIPAHRLMAVLAAEHEEDLAHLAGFRQGQETARTTSEEPVPRRFLHRAPWLLLGLAGALIAADLVGWFEAQLKEGLALMFFIPGIVYIADAVGTQTETIVIRGLSLGIPMRRMVGRELLTGLAVGLALAAVATPIVWWHWHDRALAMSVGLSMLATCSTATMAAMALPWLFDLMGIDPAFGSGPLATVVQDLLSIWIYLLVATAGIL
ncbi:MAG TPA: magnesium transporter [Vicinamibacterales bacterium]|nr:magnesium transporter [Vicinamibacterales bacterium]